MTASKDATIYYQQPTQNTGRDEILEISKTQYGGITDIARSLIKFDIDSLSNLIDSGSVTLESSELVMWGCEPEEIPVDYTIYGYAVSQSWDMGIGWRYDRITTDGVTWSYPKSGESWLPNSYSPESTGSIDGVGGVWYTGSFSSQSFSYEVFDLVMDTKPTVVEWVSGSIGNEGFILKHDSSLEDDNEDYGQLKFFSKETNTIYQPKLRIAWDDQTFQTGSLEELTDDDIKVYPRRIKSEYKLGDRVKIRIIGRELYPLKTYTDTYSYNTVKYLPQTTYYRIVDAITNDIIIPFSQYSKVSCDSEGNYIEIDLTNWETNRNYYIEVKTERSSQGIEYFSFDDLTFKVLK